MQRILVPIFIFAWWKRLNSIRANVIRVKGWRTALLDIPGAGRQTNTFIWRLKSDSSKIPG